MSSNRTKCCVRKCDSHGIEVRVFFSTRLNHYLRRNAHTGKSCNLCVSCISSYAITYRMTNFFWFGSVNKKLVIFSRYNNDAHAGQRVIFQVRWYSYHPHQVSVCPTHLVSCCLFHPHNREYVKYVFNDCYADRALHFVLIQAVGKVDARNTLSPICAITLGSGIQGGFSWTRSFSQHGKAACLSPVTRDDNYFGFW